tara:strand:+ start:603 stop:977 length:375 start_codon:yes stop_codon:yes gene_type:complete
MVRMDRIGALIEKNEKKWLEEERNRDWSHFEIETDSESEEDEDEEDEYEIISSDVEDEETINETEKIVIEEMPSLTIESKVEWRVEQYRIQLSMMTDYQIQQLCVREGILNENEVFDTICIQRY